MQATLNYLCDIFLLFFTFSVLGWCTEVILKYRQYHRFINRGFLIGPYLPIYGTGVSFATLIMDALGGYDQSVATTFIVSFLACGLLEYFVSWYMEKRFHARWWDYSQKPMNLHGRVWIGNLLLFGIGGTLIVKVVDPVFFGLTAKISNTVKPVLCAVLAALMLTDATISHFIMKMLKTGIEHSQADDTEEIGKEIHAMMADKSVFHKRFVEAYPEVVYRTDKVRQKLQAMRENTEMIRHEVNEKLEADREFIIYNIEPATLIKSDIIASQDELITILDSTEKGGTRELELREHIAERKTQLNQREHILSKAAEKFKDRAEEL